MNSDPPVLDLQGIAQGTHALIVRRVSGDQYQTVLKGNCGDHWISASNRLPRALQIGEDPSRQVRRFVHRVTGVLRW